jgi:putative DNA primase/helicase
MKLFDGYLIADGKKPLSSVKDKENWLSEPPEDTDFVGILSKDIIQIDVDDQKDAELILKIVRDMKLRCSIMRTRRGLHFYFKDDGYVRTQSVGIYNAIGIREDIGLGSKNRVVPLKLTRDVEKTRIADGEEVHYTVKETIEREWVQTYEELDELPPILRPIGNHNYNFQDTSTRNQTLFSYILVLQSKSFTKDEARKVIKTINKYVLKEALPDREIDAITRDEAFSEELFFTDKGGFLHDKFGNYMLMNSNIIMIDGQVNIYTKDGIYSNDPLEFERVMIDKIPQLKDSQRKEVYKYVALKCDLHGEFASPKYLGFKDFILDIETGENFPYAPKWIIQNRIEYNYNPEAYHELMDKTLDKVACGDKQIRSLLEEMIGYSLYRKNSLQVAFILTGEGSNGKSTILNLIKKLIGKPNYTSLDLRELEDSFKPSEMYNKLANIGDDISAKYLETSSIFKKVVTGESFMVQRKYAQPFTLESYATQIFCANQLPSVNDHSDGFSRRLVIVPFNAKFSKYDVDYDPFIEEKLMEDEAIEYLVKIAVEGLKRALYNKSFTKSEVGEKEKDIYLRSNNNVLEWIDEEAPEVENESVADIYREYSVWCSLNGARPVKKITLSKEIKKVMSLTTRTTSINGKSVRIYCKE